eukprot:CAMPEP_0178480842 /NCGR_PEP_ID=MMETSP0696-20121128/5905_1 /TAXON_ID=265572 /ORGANISM="Extubocellulus spinifer, Strain CCMP396" /LENGTH=744 /DNA_ID=CAMNT_0020108297 /DNA_START=79 /DNA_END=2313 /DNA_ORIENTATION=+
MTSTTGPGQPQRPISNRGESTGNQNDENDSSVGTIEQQLPPPPPSIDSGGDSIQAAVVETSQPPPRYMRNHSGRDLSNAGGPGSSRSLNSGKARLTTAPATQPGVEQAYYVPRNVTGAAYVRETLAATESGAHVIGQVPSLDKAKSCDTLVTATTESFDDYMARKRRQNAHLGDFGRNNAGEEADNENGEQADVDPYAHLRNQPSRPRPESDSTLMPVAYEVEARPVYEEEDSGRKRRKNPLKDWRVLLFLAVALSAIVGLTVALLMQNKGGGSGDNHKQPTNVAPTGTTVPPTNGANEEDSGANIMPTSEPIIPNVEPHLTNVPNEMKDKADASDATMEPSSKPTKMLTAAKPVSESSNAPTLAPTADPDTASPTMSVVTVSESTNAPTSAPTAAPDSASPTMSLATESPTTFPTIPATEDVTADIPLSFEINPFRMSIISSTQLDKDSLLQVTSDHLLDSMRKFVPNLSSMTLEIDLSAPTKRRNLRKKEEQTTRELQLQFASFTAIFTGNLVLKDDTFTPTDDDVRSALTDAFSGENLESYMGEKMALLRINIGALVVKDSEGNAIGSDSGGVNAYGAVSGFLQTPLTDRFSRAGVMFDITAKDFPIRITSLSIHTQSKEKNLPLELLIKEESYVGFEGDEAAWSTPVQYTLETGMGLGKLTPIPADTFQSFTVPAGQTIGVYVTLTDGKGMLMGQTTSLGGGRTENALVRIESGSSIGYRFGQVNKNRAWGGQIRYELAT